MKILIKISLTIQVNLKKKRLLNKKFALSRYSEPWSKLERHLFIEIYNSLKDFYIGFSDSNIKEFNQNNMLVRLPLNHLNLTLFKKSNLSRDLPNICDRISSKKISFTTKNEGEFVTIFPKVKYNKKEGFIEFFMFNSIYDEMLPIESYCQLNFNILGQLESGNAIRLYEIFKAYGFLNNFTIKIDVLRKKMGFFDTNKYCEW